MALEELDRTGRLLKTKRKEMVNFTIDEEVMRMFMTSFSSRGRARRAI